jgi:hypothetical protein
VVREDALRFLVVSEFLQPHFFVVEFKQQQARNASLALPAILPSQLPVLSIPLATVEPPAAAKPASGDSTAPSLSAPPATLSLTLTLSGVDEKYIPIAQRTLSLAQATSVRCQQIADEIRQKVLFTFFSINILCGFFFQPAYPCRPRRLCRTLPLRQPRTVRRPFAS